MADVTARLLWYRLKESSQNLQVIWDGMCFFAEAGGMALNCIFVTWILFGLLTFLYVTISKSYEKKQDEERKRQQSYRQGGASLNCQKCRYIAHVEEKEKEELRYSTPEPPSNEWLSTVISWIHAQENSWKSRIIVNMLTALTEESHKQGGDLFLTFEALLPVGDPPILNLTASIKSADGKPALKGEVQLSGLQLSLTSSDNSVSIHSNILLIVNLVSAKLDVELNSTSEELLLLLSIEEICNCDIKFSPYHQGVDYITDEKKLTHHVKEIFGKLRIPLRLLVKPGTLPDPVQEETIYMAECSMEEASAPQTRPPKPPRTIDEKRLMVKLIKATRLNKRNRGVLIQENLVVKVLNARGLRAWRLSGAIDAYCIVDVDHPFQTHSTSVVKNTVNPYWDEHFLFDLGSNTKKITFRVYGHSKEIDDGTGGTACLGEAETDLETLRLNHGIRTVLPLESRPEMADAVSGSVTIEAFFVDSAEFEQRDSPDVDDVFAQSVEPLLPLHDEIELSDAAPIVNGQTALSNESLASSSASKIIKTQTYVLRKPSRDDLHGEVPVVEKSETVKTVQSDGVDVMSEETRGLREDIDLANAGFISRRTHSVEDYRKHRFSLTLGRKRTSWLSVRSESRPSSFSFLVSEVITVYPNQSVTEVVMKELQERANRPKSTGQKTTSTIIITAATKEPVVRQPLASLASVESLSDDSSGGVPSSWDVSPQQQPSAVSPQTRNSPGLGGQRPQYSMGVPNIEEPTTPVSPKVERKSRFSSIKRRFTRTKDKKPRSHSIERSSGIDEHRYLDPNTSSHPIGQSHSSNNVTSDPISSLPPKKKFGGSLRKLFHMKKRSNSASRASTRRKNILNDLEKPISNYDKLSIEGDRPYDHGSRSSFEKDPTPPHHRTLSPSSSSYSYKSQNHSPDPPRQSRLVAMTASQPYYSDDGDGMYSGLIEDRRHYSMPSQKRSPRRPL